MNALFSNSMFKWFEVQVNQESEKRDAIRGMVKDLETALRVIETHLQQIQQLKEAAASDIVRQAGELFTDVRKQFERLQSAVPANQFYRYKDR